MFVQYAYISLCIIDIRGEVKYNLFPVCVVNVGVSVCLSVGVYNMTSNLYILCVFTMTSNWYILLTWRQIDIFCVCLIWRHIGISYVCMNLCEFFFVCECVFVSECVCLKNSSYKRVVINEGVNSIFHCSCCGDAVETVPWEVSASLINMLPFWTFLFQGVHGFL